MHAPTIRFATAADAEVILRFIRGLAAYEREPDAVKATAAGLRAQIESASPPFECLIANDGDTPLGFALFYRSYSTWLGQPALFLEDFFVEEKYRGRGAGLPWPDASRGSRANAATRDSNGACSTGTTRPIASIDRSAQVRLTNGRCGASKAMPSNVWRTIAPRVPRNSRSSGFDVRDSFVILKIKTRVRDHCSF